MIPVSLPHPLGSAAWAGRRIGLLGGSFNPPHAGHVHASLLALRTLELDQVWWLVSPQNPLKPRRGMAPFAERLALCHALVRHPRILVTGLETELGTRFTADTLEALRARYSRTRFVWFMGADNLIDIRRWQRWHEIFRDVPVAVYDRPPYSSRTGSSLAAHRFARFRLTGNESHGLGSAAPPAWAFFHTKMKAISSTAIRAERKESEP